MSLAALAVRVTAAREKWDALRARSGKGFCPLPAMSSEECLAIERYERREHRRGLALVPSQAADQQVTGVEDTPSIFSLLDQEVTYCIEPFMLMGGIGALTGESGSGKTTVAIAMAHSISNGLPFAGMATQQRPVLYLDFENHQSVVIERFRRLGIIDSDWFRYRGQWLDRLALATILDWVERTDPKPVIFIDSLVAHMEGADENEARAMRQHMDGYRAIASRGSSVVVIHHSGKGENTKDYRGSSDFKASLDVGYVVANIGDPTRLEHVRLKAFKCRVAVTPEITLHFRDGEFHADSDVGASSTNADALRAILISNPGVGAAEFETLAVGLGVRRNRARKFLTEAVAGGLVRTEVGLNNKRFHTWALGEGE